MDYQGKYNNKTVAAFLINDVHPVMDAKYNTESRQKTDNADAAQLQQFFKELKLAAEGRKNNSNIITNLAIETILDTLQEIKSKQQWNYDVENLFHRRGGDVFERELTDIITTIIYLVSDETLESLSALKQEINIGEQKGNVMTIEESLKLIPQELLKKTGVKMEKKIVDESGNARKLHYLPDVEGKIDVSANNLDIKLKVNPDATMLKIWNLLSKATFSAKNYDSLTWDEKIKAWVDAHHDKIKVGDGNVIRAIYGALNKVGIWDHETIISAICAGYEAVHRYHVKTVSEHFFHLRYIYELTGAGISYGNGFADEVRFFIYNDPHGDIYVKSTAGILGEVLNNQPAFRGNPFKDIYIKKAYFHE